jgi:hypothetical protein
VGMPEAKLNPLLGRPDNVRFCADNGLKPDIAPCPFGATSGLMHRNKSLQHSIRSQAIS